MVVESKCGVCKFLFIPAEVLCFSELYIDIVMSSGKCPGNSRVEWMLQSPHLRFCKAGDKLPYSPWKAIEEQPFWRTQRDRS